MTARPHHRWLCLSSTETREQPIAIPAPPPEPPRRKETMTTVMTTKEKLALVEDFYRAHDLKQTPPPTTQYCARCGARLGAQNPHDECDDCRLRLW